MVFNLMHDGYLMIISFNNENNNILNVHYLSSELYMVTNIDNGHIHRHKLMCHEISDKTCVSVPLT